jgi:hypothetical protein
MIAAGTTVLTNFSMAQALLIFQGQQGQYARF